MDAAQGLDIVRAHGSATRWMYVGRSADRDATVAARAALTAATGDLQPKLLIVFAAASYDLDEVARTLRDGAPDAAIAGCVTGGEISAHGAGDNSLVVIALGGDGFAVSTAAIRVAGSLRDAAADAAACVGDVADREHIALILFTDGVSGDPREVVRGAYSVAGAAVPLIGGCVRPQSWSADRWQIHDGEAVHDSVVAIAIGSDAPLGVGVSHGWSADGEPMFVSRTLGRTILTLDDQPALDRYLDHGDAPAQTRTDPAAFTRWADGHPLGIRRSRGRVHVRHIVTADFAMRALQVQIPVAQGSLVSAMRGDRDSVLQATDAACGEALAALHDDAPTGLIAFDCVSRRIVLADTMADEITRFSAHAAGAPLAGLYTFGEIARASGVSGFHNHAIAVLALG
jgi:hypothetical protein